MILLMTAAFPAQSDASMASKALAKARAVMQSAFQLSFLNKLPVIFYKNHFDTMFEHTNRSIDEMNLKYGDRTITADNFQNDKKLHIKKSAELALHIQSLIGSKHLAYGITMVIGAIKEAIDGSFLNPSGSRSKEDLYADHVGARAVFGKEKYDESLNKYLGHFVKPQADEPAAEAVTENKVDLNRNLSSPVPAIENKSYDKPKPKDSLAARQQLLQKYYRAAEIGDANAMKQISAQLQALP